MFYSKLKPNPNHDFSHELLKSFSTYWFYRAESKDTPRMSKWVAGIHGPPGMLLATIKGVLDFRIQKTMELVFKENQVKH